MTLYTTSMDLPDTFESIQSAPDQKVAIDSYFKMNAALTRFLKWYSSYDARKFQDEITYKNDVTHQVSLISCLNDLESLSRYPVEQQVKILNRVLSKVSDKGMMLLEICLTKDLTEYYPEIDWDYINQTYNMSV